MALPALRGRRRGGAAGGSSLRCGACTYRFEGLGFEDELPAALDSGGSSLCSPSPDSPSRPPAGFPPPPQSIGRDALTAEGASAFWAARYTLRPALDPRSGTPVAPPPGGAPAHDVPTFLARVKDAVLSTGEAPGWSWWLTLTEHSTAQQPMGPVQFGEPDLRP